MADDFELEEELLAVAGHATRKRKAKKAGIRDEDEVGDMFESDAEDSDDDDPASKLPVRKRQKNKAAAAAAGGGSARDLADDADLYEDEEDEQKLAAMTELEREMILAERAEKRNRAKQRAELLQETKGKEGKGPAVRASSRRKAPEASKAAKQLEDLKDLRERRAARSRAKAPAARKGKRRDESEEEESEQEEGAVSSEDEASDEGDDSDDVSLEAEEAEDEDEQEGSGARQRAGSDMDDDEVDEERGGLMAERLMKEDEPLDEAEFKDFRAAQVKRTQLERWFDKPFFERCLPGCFVKVPLGEETDPRTGEKRPRYVLLRVLGFTAGTTYKLGEGKSTKTYLQCQDGGFPKNKIMMSTVSNRDVEEDDYDRWQRHCKLSNREPVTRTEVQQAVSQIKEAEGFVWRSEDVRRQVEENKRMGAAAVNVTVEKVRIKHQLEAVGDNDPEAKARLLEQLALMEEQDRQAQQKAKARDGMSRINLRNKTHNFQMALTNATNRPEGEKIRTGVDPFSRRATRPNIYWNTKGAAAAKRAASGEVDVAAAEARAALVEAPEKLKAAQQRMDPAELIKVLDLDINTSLLANVPPRGSAQLLAQRMLGHTWTQPPERLVVDINPKNMLSLEDWKARAGDMEQGM